MKKKYSIENINTIAFNNTIIYFSLFIVLSFILVFLILIYFQNSHSHIHKHNKEKKTCITTPQTSTIVHIDKQRVSDNHDVLLNPYSSPLRDNRYLPINVSTNIQAVNTNYRQIGILTRGNTILPLMGKPLFTNRDKWNFYTMNDKNNMIKLPLSNKGRSCTNEYGCDNIYNGDTVYVEGYNDTFKATIYDNQVIEYIPYI